MRYCCTLFDSNYISFGLALYDSLERHFSAYHLWVLCLDEECYEKLNSLALKNVTLVSLHDIETEEVLNAKKNRSWQEFCWTLGSVFTLYVLERYSYLYHIIYLDADICFFSSPEPIFKEIKDASIMIIPHRFPQRLRYLEENGMYNVQMMYFRKDKQGVDCLRQWVCQCLEWCYARIEDGKMGDQKYLDKWPSHYKSLCVLQNICAGVAPWNMEQYSFSIDNDKPMVNGEPLIFFHYHGFKYFKGGYYIVSSHTYSFTSIHISTIYEPYLQMLAKINEKYGISGKKIDLLQLVFTSIANDCTNLCVQREGAKNIQLGLYKACYRVLYLLIRIFLYVKKHLNILTTKLLGVSITSKMTMEDFL